MTTLAPESLVIGSFYKDKAFHIYRLDPSSILDVNGDPMQPTAITREMLRPMRELLQDVFDTVSVGNNQKLQEILFHPNTRFQLKNNTVQIIPANGEAPFDLSDLAVKKIKESSSGKVVETSSDTFADRVPQALRLLGGKDRPSDILAHSRTSLMEAPYYYGPSSQDSASMLPHLALWCKGGFRTNPDALRAIYSFEQRIRTNYLDKQKEIQTQLEKEKDPKKQQELQEVLRPEKFIKDQVDQFFKEIESQYSKPTDAPAEVAYLKADNRLLRQITAQWEEILDPSSSNRTGLTKWTKYLTFQNIALGALGAAAFYFLAPTLAVTTVVTGFLASRQVDTMDHAIRNFQPLDPLKNVLNESVSSLQPLKCWGYVHPTLRKVATVALVGLTTVALSSWIAPAKLITAAGVYYFGMQQSSFIRTIADKIPLLNYFPKVATTLVAATTIAFLTGYSPVVYLGALAGGLIASSQTDFISERLGALPAIKENFDKLPGPAKWILTGATAGLLAFIAGTYLIPSTIATLLSYSTAVTGMLEPYMRSQFLPSLGWAGSLASTFLFPTYATAALALFPLAKEACGYLLKTFPTLKQMLASIVPEEEGQKNLLSILAGLASMHFLPSNAVGFLTLFGLLLSWSKNYFSENKKLGKAALASFVGTAAIYGLLQYYLFPFGQEFVLRSGARVITGASTLYSSLIPESLLGKILLFPAAVITKQWIKLNARRLTRRLPNWILPTSEKTSWLATTIIWGTIFNSATLLTSPFSLLASSSIFSNLFSTISNYYSEDASIPYAAIVASTLVSILLFTYGYIFKAHATETPSRMQKFLPYLSIFGALALPFMNTGLSALTEGLAPLTDSTSFKFAATSLAIFSLQNKKNSPLKKSLLALPFITMLLPYLKNFDISTFMNFGGQALMGTGLTTIPHLLQGNFRDALATITPTLKKPETLVINAIKGKALFWVLSTLLSGLTSITSGI